MKNNIIDALINNPNVDTYTKLILYFNYKQNYLLKNDYSINEILKFLKIKNNDANIKKISRNLKKMQQEKQLIIFKAKRCRYFKFFLIPNIFEYQNTKNALNMLKMAKN